MDRKLIAICTGIQHRLDRSELLEDILSTYIKLTDDEKDIIRQHFNV